MNYINYIREVQNAQPDMDGFVIDTYEETIFILIGNEQSCCEHWGMITSDDDFQKYEGAELKDVVIVDKALESVEVEDLEEGSAIFVNVETNRGTIQFALYNAHNGYYGHTVKVIRSKKVIVHQCSL